MLIPLPEIGFPDLIAKRTIFEDLGQISLSWGHIPFKKVNDKLCKVSFYSTLFFFFVEQEFELRALPHLHSILLWLFRRWRFSRTICLSFLQITILLISQVAKITGVSYWCPAVIYIL
jgi:hypothetical protein